MEAKIKENLDFLKNNFIKIKGKISIIENEVERLEKENMDLKNDLEFYKSIFKTHPNSAIFNLHIKKKNGERVWIDKNTQYWSLHELDDDPEVKDAIETIIQAGKKHNIAAGFHSVSSDPHEAYQRQQQGFTFLAFSTDAILLGDASIVAMKQLKASN